MNPKKSILYSGGLIFSFCLIELVGGYVSKSLTLISDAGHMFIDLLPLAGAYFSIKITAGKWKNSNYTFGYKNIEPIVGMISSVVISIFLIFEVGGGALLRLWHGSEIPDVRIMFAAGAIGFLVNYLAGSFLHKYTEDNLAIKSAFLHNKSDMLLSVVVMIASVLTFLTQQEFWDPVLSLGMAGYLLVFPIKSLFKETGRILLAGVPVGLDIDKIKEEIMRTERVIEVLDLHFWDMSGNFKIATLHILLEKKISYLVKEKIKNDIRKILHKFEINHSTIEFEDLQIGCATHHCGG